MGSSNRPNCYHVISNYPNGLGWCYTCEYVIGPLDWKFIWCNIYEPLKKYPSQIDIHLVMYDGFMEVVIKNEFQTYN